MFFFATHRVAAGAALLGAALAQAQSSSQQIVKPPQAQAWIDIATFSGMGMPAMGGAGGGNPMAAALGGLFGGSGAKGNSFGQTQAGGGGRWVDVTLYSRGQPQLAEAQQAVPGGFLPAPLKLQAPKDVPSVVDTPEERDSEPHQQYERPKGRILMYWGCDKTIRPGQPRVLDMATATPADLSKFFVSRRATQRGTHSAAGRPVWPSRDDTRMVPAQASLVGEHVFSGVGIPEGFRFQIPSAQDLMPAVALQQRQAEGATELSWNAIPAARAYFAAAMGSGGGENEMVIWTSSELPDNGFGLVDYQTNAAVDRWLKDKVLLAPTTTQCSIPKGVFKGEGGGAMLRLIAHGSELNLVHPPRPSDPKQPWEQVWAAKLRVKSVASAMLGMPAMAGGMMPTPQETATEAVASDPAAEAAPPDGGSKKAKAINLLRGLLGR